MGNGVYGVGDMKAAMPAMRTYERTRASAKNFFQPEANQEMVAELQELENKLENVGSVVTGEINNAFGADKQAQTALNAARSGNMRVFSQNSHAPRDAELNVKFNQDRGMVTKFQTSKFGKQIDTLTTKMTGREPEDVIGNSYLTEKGGANFIQQLRQDPYSFGKCENAEHLADTLQKEADLKIKIQDLRDSIDRDKVQQIQEHYAAKEEEIPTLTDKVEKPNPAKTSEHQEKVAQMKAQSAARKEAVDQRLAERELPESLKPKEQMMDNPFMDIQPADLNKRFEEPIRAEESKTEIRDHVDEASQGMAAEELNQQVEELNKPSLFARMKNAVQEKVDGFKAKFQKEEQVRYEPIISEDTKITEPDVLIEGEPDKTSRMMHERPMTANEQLVDIKSRIQHNDALYLEAHEAFKANAIAKDLEAKTQEIKGLTTEGYNDFFHKELDKLGEEGAEVKAQMQLMKDLAQERQELKTQLPEFEAEITQQEQLAEPAQEQAIDINASYDEYEQMMAQEEQPAIAMAPEAEVTPAPEVAELQHIHESNDKVEIHSMNEETGHIEAASYNPNMVAGEILSAKEVLNNPYMNATKSMADSIGKAASAPAKQAQRSPELVSENDIRDKFEGPSRAKAR